MRLTDEELTTLLDQVQPHPLIRERVTETWRNDGLSYVVLSGLLGEDRHCLEQRVYAIRKRRDREEAHHRPRRVYVERGNLIRMQHRNGSVGRDHGPLIGLNRYTGEYEEVWLRSPYP